MNDKLHIRTAQINDAEELLAIYKPYIENTAITFEYNVPTVEEFANRIKTTLKKYPYIVAELNGKIVGYAYAGVFKGRKAYDWSVETSIYIRLENHGNGIGRKLYEKLEEILAKQGVTNANPVLRTLNMRINICITTVFAFTKNSVIKLSVFFINVHTNLISGTI